jgi:hypothetical protein
MPDQLGKEFGTVVHAITLGHECLVNLHTA